MVASRRRRSVSPWLRCLQMSKFIWIPAVVICILGFLTFFLSIYPNKLMEMFKRFIKLLPVWVPLWSIPALYGSLDHRLPNIEDLHQDAYRAHSLVETLKEHRFFRIFKADLSRECPFWVRREMCTSDGACNICEYDQEKLPLPWKMKPIENFVDRHHYKSDHIEPWGSETTSRVNNDHDDDATTASLISLVKPDNGLFIMPNGGSVSDERSESASYVDLTLKRPGFTAYQGRNIWGLIYKENCMGHQNNPLESVVGAQAPSECTEEDTFHKIVSGLQTVIMILSSEYHHSKKSPAEYHQLMEEYKREDKILSAAAFRSQYSPDMKLFKERVAVERAWLQNLYFTFGVLLRTLCHVGPILETCDCNTGSPEDDQLAKGDLLKLLNEPFAACREAFLDVPLFQRKQRLALEQFRNISRIMDCLECEKCRLHGKVKIVALQLALRASGRDARVRRVERNEVIALINSIGYFADAVVILDKRRLMILQIVWACGVFVSGIAIYSLLRYCKSVKDMTSELEFEKKFSDIDVTPSETSDMTSPNHKRHNEKRKRH